MSEKSISKRRSDDMRPVLIDGHVHIHDCFDLSVLLDAAADNFNAAARDLGVRRDPCAVLLLCDNNNYSQYKKLTALAQSRSRIGEWLLSPTAESAALLARRSSGARIVVISGRQIQTREKLEVLALCTDADHPDDLPIEESIAQVQRADGIPVLPWGFGKWLGRRGAIIHGLVRRAESGAFLLGDNSGRLQAAGEPSLFRLARSAGCGILAGTDPLPFPGQERRVGGYGAYVEGAFQEHLPCVSTRALLAESWTTLTTYGHRERLVNFVKNQLRMQHLKRWHRNAYSCS